IENNDLKFKNKYRIQSIRLNSWDYCNNGYYFVTICTKDRICNFGKIENEIMYLSQTGVMAKKYWLEIPKHFPFVKLDEFVVMPNHVHGILIIEKQNVETQNLLLPRSIKQNVETQNFASLQKTGIKNKFGPQSKNLASIIRGFKIGVKKYTTNNNIPFTWQTRFYDHVIRNEKSLNEIRQYIIGNPKKWQLDKNNLM